MARNAPAVLFHAIWRRSAVAPAKLQQTDMLQVWIAERQHPITLVTRRRKGILHLISTLPVIRVVVFNKSIEAIRMGRVVQRIVEVETYRLLSLLGLATVKAHSTRLTDIEEVLNGLTNDLAKEIKKPDGQVRSY